MDDQNGLLGVVLDGHVPHLGAAHRFADGLGIIGVVLAGSPLMAVRCDQFGIHDARLVAELLQFSRPMMGAGASFHPDATRGKIAEVGQELGALQRPLDLALLLLVNAIEDKKRLGQIDTDTNNL